MQSGIVFKRALVMLSLSVIPMAGLAGCGGSDDNGGASDSTTAPVLSPSVHKAPSGGATTSGAKTPPGPAGAKSQPAPSGSGAAKTK